MKCFEAVYYDELSNVRLYASVEANSKEEAEAMIEQSLNLLTDNFQYGKLIEVDRIFGRDRI